MIIRSYKGEAGAEKVSDQLVRVRQSQDSNPVWPVPFPPFSHKGTRGDCGRCVWLSSNGLALCGLHGAGWGIAAGPLCEDPLWVFARRPHTSPLSLPPLLPPTLCSPPSYHPPQQTARIPTVQSTVGQSVLLISGPVMSGLQQGLHRCWQMTAWALRPTRPRPGLFLQPPAPHLLQTSGQPPLGVTQGPSLPSCTAPQETEALLETLCPLHPSPQQPRSRSFSGPGGWCLGHWGKAGGP